MFSRLQAVWPWRTTIADPAAVRPPDLVQRDFTASGPNELWVSDFTYLRCWEGRVYFAFVAPENEHVHLGFEHGWAMRDPHRQLKGAGITKRVRWLTFVDVGEVDVEGCIELVREAARVAAMSRGERELQSIDQESERPSS